MKNKIGIDVKVPSKECEDKKCPFHGNLNIKKSFFKGVVVSKDTHKTVAVEWSYRVFVPKYERYETRRTKILVHNPSCINANVGDLVRIALTRPISKTKTHVIIENFGREKGFGKELEAREEAKIIIGKKERKKEEVTENEGS